ncbi:hypothetical protein JCM1393_12330 [Clostridium carnis]
MELGKRRLTIGEILSKALDLFTQNWVELLKIIGVFAVPIVVLIIIAIGTGVGISVVSSYSYYDDLSYLLANVTAIFGIMIIILLISLICMYCNFAVIKFLNDANNGVEATWKNSLKYVWNKKWSILGLTILVALMGMAFSIIMIISVIIITLLTLGIGLVLVIPALIAIAIIIAPINLLFSVMLVVRDLSVTEAISETFRLFRKGFFWRTIGKMAAIGGVTAIAGLVLVIFEFIPFIGVIITLVGSLVIQAYTIAACILATVEIDNKSENFADNNPII